MTIDIRPISRQRYQTASHACPISLNNQSAHELSVKQMTVNRERYVATPAPPGFLEALLQRGIEMEQE